jgi:single-strand DNA-binding protein
MAADNQTTIAGNLVEDPELRFTNTGTPVTNLRVAVTQRVQQDGEWRDGETSFFKVNVWRGRAEHLADSLAKGDRVMVTGRLRQRSWETPEGERRSVAELEADEVGASLKWATARVERATSAASDDRTRVGSGRPNAVISTSHRRSEPPSRPLQRGPRFLVEAFCPGRGGGQRGWWLRPQFGEDRRPAVPPWRRRLIGRRGCLTALAKRPTLS